MNRAAHPMQRSSRLSELDSLFELVEPVPLRALDPPLPIGESSDGDWATWDHAQGGDEAVWRAVA